MPERSTLDNISIVLVHTKAPANIGSVARCMMNMGLSRLFLVQPPADPENEARKLAAGADRVLDAARTFGTLAEAVADHHLVLGTSRHLTRHRRNVGTPREAAERIVPFLGTNRAALVFGNEVNGLERDDLALCNGLIAIPSSGAFPSLNLSHAVMVIAYELFLAVHAGFPTSTRQLESSEKLERFYNHLQASLRDIGFLDDMNSEQMMFTLRQIFGRATLEPRDVSILRGVLTAISESNRESH